MKDDPAMTHDVIHAPNQWKSSVVQLRPLFATPVITLPIVERALENSNGAWSGAPVCWSARRRCPVTAAAARSASRNSTRSGRRSSSTTSSSRCTARTRGYARYYGEWQGSDSRDAPVPAAGLPHAVERTVGRPMTVGSALSATALLSRFPKLKVAVDRERAPGWLEPLLEELDRHLQEDRRQAATLSSISA